MDRTAMAHLVVQAQSGDGEALSSLARGNYGPLRSIVAARVPVDDVDDVIQDSLEAMTQAIGQIRDPQAFQSWLNTAARRCATSKAESRVRYRADSQIDVADDSRGQDELVESADDIRRLRLALARLPKRDRQILVDRHLHDLSVSEVARRHGLTVQSAHNALSRARVRTLQIFKGIPAVFALAMHDRVRRSLANATMVTAAHTIEIAAIAILALGVGAFVASNEAFERELIAADGSGQAIALTEYQAAATQTSQPHPEGVVPNTVDFDGLDGRPLAELPDGTILSQPDAPAPGAHVRLTVSASGDDLEVHVYADEAESASGQDIDQEASLVIGG
jgi:RNA polymerase sigma factor (sigma-70 family)